ncbi:MULTISPECIES: response regulator transcription factor [Mesoflavibacter]|uniref:DNA-binding response regulator n=1 Tax=Mesoflavibacter zeaxanthinifaciens subsp. sabulilitoris TaxID=1520893 RepID=A0A2T1NM25_9FLAO|nr:MULTISPECIES: response regulator transcription factor [Mesoflavibacter]MBB3124574.1 DNA-binding NarL/FixJ family response regulator [Mesoflavibacter zeaxanthinifaciens subsp. sabulilitoris]MCP4052639.1 response regulator transcription factor [Mesoflavibacter sp.]PSG93940.1 DNA-binding response regulator [Mesoflavibacter zeaxanthinifaciens subsp. sabulilitoris]UAB74360.1 response regulator transcription factor [Mesoflavibacter sp. SCSIO 43206]
MKIAIIDDNSFLISSIKEKLSFFEEIQVKYTANNGADLLEKLDKDHNLDALLMDIEMPVLNGIETTLAVKQKYPQIKIIMLTVFDNDENIFNAIKAGADGYLLKDVNPHELFNGIVDTLNGGAAMNPSIALKTLKLLRNPVDFKDVSKEEINLTNREVEVLEQLSKGLSYKVIADNLFLSPSTVRKHIENIYSKLQVHSKLEAVQKARRNNLI